MVPFETFFLMVVTVFVVFIAITLTYVHDLLFQLSRDVRALRRRGEPALEELETVKEYKSRFRRNMAISLVILIVLEFLLCNHLFVL